LHQNWGRIHVVLHGAQKGGYLATCSPQHGCNSGCMWLISHHLQTGFM
jgi:hypothetical protein